MAHPHNEMPQAKPPQVVASHSYPTRQQMASNTVPTPQEGYSPSINAGVMNAQTGMYDSYHPFPTDQVPKKVAFELLLDEESKTKARIPMRVLINAHDTTESIVTTVKNFYGVYEGKGVSFEDNRGNTLIARYENLDNDMTVYVRVVPAHIHSVQAFSGSEYGPPNIEASRALHPYEVPHLPPPLPAQALDYGQSQSRPPSAPAMSRSDSPHHGRGRRSASTQKVAHRQDGLSRGSSTHGNYQEDCSDSDCGNASVTSSRKAKSEQYVSADISLENIVQDGRRKRPKFESSELPLFVPPQVPLTTSSSSISPQRRSTGQEGPSPFAQPTQRTFAYPTQMYSPQSHSYSEQRSSFLPPISSAPPVPAAQGHGHGLRDRSNTQPFALSSSSKGGNRSSGILPTPDPTIASCISDEDVARQLIALGSNYSHGRTSTSTLDDALSGVADVASSIGATSDSDEDVSDDADHLLTKRDRFSTGVGQTSKLPKGNRSDTDDVDEDYENDDQDVLAKSEGDDYDGTLPKAKKAKTKPSSIGSLKNRSSKVTPSLKAAKANKNRPSGPAKKQKSTPHGQMKAPALPNGSPSQSRKTSSSSTLNFQHQLAADEEDLSSKPRCQRCRKSKKGCDRQRPCQRCKDAGIGIEGCVSEDEGNGRKGRYGRHMGVPVKKAVTEEHTEHADQAAGAILSGMISADSKKRKR